MVLNAVRQAFLSYKSPKDKDIQLTEVLIGDEDSSADICRQIFGSQTEPTFVIDATESQQTSPKVKNLVREMGIPTISTTYQLGSGILNWRNLDDTEKQYLIHVNQPGDTMPLMVKDIVTHFNYKTVAVYYDKSFRKYLFINILKLESGAIHFTLQCHSLFEIKNKAYHIACSFS